MMAMGLGLRVLTYHRVADPEQTPLLHPRMVSATPAVFARQMQHLARHYHPVGLDAVLAAWCGGVTLPKGAVLVTFDDAYRDFLTTAWPILRAERIPVALFVPTAHATQPQRAFWWDRLHASVTTTSRTSFEHPRFGRMELGDAPHRSAVVRALQTAVKGLPHEAGMALVDEIVSLLGEKTFATPATCDWDELRRLEREGVALGAHTRTHPLLTQLSPPAAREEVAGSLADLRRETVAALPVFAYPAGAHDSAVVEIVRQCGVHLAFTQVDGHSAPSRDDALRICRTNITRKSTLPIFRMRLWSWMAQVDRWRHRPRAVPTLAAMSPAAAVVPPVAYVMSRFPKLTETFILNEIVALEAAGQPVAIFPLLRQRQSVQHSPAAQLAARAHFEPFVSWNIVRDNLYWLCHRPRAYLGAWWEVLRGTAPSLNFFIGALGILPKSARQARRMQQAGVTHVHAHFATHPAVCALFVHRLTAIPFSFTAHGSDLHVDRTMLARKVEAAAFVVAISQFNRGVILGANAGRFAERIHVVHCGVDLSLFSPSRRTDHDGVFRILCVASFEPVKGHEVLVRACAQLAARGVAFRCDLVGDGPEQERIAAAIAAQHLAGHVEIQGPQSRDAIAALLAEADAFALASVPTPQGKREGIPVVLMEAMARRLPVVASRLSGIPELISDGVNGMLVEPRDQAGLAAALEKLAADPRLRKRLGRAARITIESRFDQRASAEQLLALIRGVAPA